MALSFAMQNEGKELKVLKKEWVFVCFYDIFKQKIHLKALPL